MKSFYKFLLVALLMTSLSLTGCYSMLKSGMNIRLNHSFDYVYVEMPTELLSGVDAVVPADLIAEAYANKGFTIIPELRDDLLKKTLIVKYLESNRRDLENGCMIDCAIDVFSPYDNNHVFTNSLTDQTINGPDDVRALVKKVLSSIL